jgi:hypothetical protein
MLALDGGRLPEGPQRSRAWPSHSKRKTLHAAILALLSWFWSGCAAAPARHTALLAPAQKPPESVGLEIFVLRYLPDDLSLSQHLWEQVDEQQLPPGTRRLLAANGLRAGLVGVQLPEPLVQAMNLPERPAEDPESTQLLEVAQQPRLARRLLQIRSGQQGRIITTGEFARHAELAVLVRNEQGEVAGRTYRQVMGLLALEVHGLGDGRIRLELTPQIEHGEPQRTVVARQGIMHYEFGPARESFDELRLSAVLAPGQSLLMGAWPEQAGTIGRQLFGERISGREEQKLVLIRLLQPQADVLLAPGRDPQLSEASGLPGEGDGK